MNVQVSTVVMMLMLGSIALIGVGVGVLLQTNQRNILVPQFNQVVKDWPSTGRFNAQRTTITVTGGGKTLPMTFIYGGEPIQGSSDSLSATSAEVNIWTASMPLANTYTFAINVGGAAAGTMTAAAISSTMPTAVSQACTSDMPYFSGGTCSDTALQSYCRSTITGDSTVGTFVKDSALTGAACTTNLVCGTCQFSYYLQARTDMIQWSDTKKTYEMVSQLGWPSYPQGLVYPWNFTNQEYVVQTQTTTNVTLRPLGEPWMVVQNLTQGSMDFGQTLDDQRKTGLIQIAIGTVVILLCIGALIGLRFMGQAAKKKKAAEKAEAAALAARAGGAMDNGAAHLSVEMTAVHNQHGPAAAAPAAAVGQQQNPLANQQPQGQWNGQQQPQQWNGQGGQQQQQQPQQGWNGQQQNNNNNSGWGNNNGPQGDGDFAVRNGADRQYSGNTRAAGGTGGRRAGNSDPRAYGGRRNSVGSHNSGGSNGQGYNSHGSRGENSSRTGSGHNAGQGGSRGSRGSRDDVGSQHSNGSAQVAEALQRGPRGNGQSSWGGGGRGGGGGGTSGWGQGARSRGGGFQSSPRQSKYDDPDL